MTNPYTQQLNQIQKGGSLTGASLSVNNDKVINPYASQLVEVNKQSQDNFGGDNNSYENDNSFSTTYKNFLSYMGNLGKKAMSGTGMDGVIDPSVIESGTKQMFQNISSDLSNAINYYKQTPISQVGQDAKGMFGEGLDQVSKSSPGSIASGLLQGFIEKPINALTGTVNDNGSARPATPQEQAQSMQATVGLVAQIGSFKLLKSSMIGAGLEGEGAINALQPTNVGKLAISPGIKLGAKYIGSDVAAGGLSGGIQGGISGIGQDNQHEQIIASALGMLPLSLALGVLGAKGYVNDIKSSKVEFINENVSKAVKNIAAVNALRINPSDPISVLTNNVDAVSSSDSQVNAAIKSKLNVGDGYIVEGVSPELGNTLKDQILNTDKPKPVELTPIESQQIKAGLIEQEDGTYNPPGELNKARPKPNSTEVKFDSPIDKVAYLAATRGTRSNFVQGLVDDLSDQTGLTDQEITSHGQFVRLQQKKLFKQESLQPRSQAEIDTYNNASISKGQDIVSSLPEGSNYKDNQGTVWTRKGNTVVSNLNGQDVALPVDQNNTLMQLGRKSDDSPFYKPYQNIPAQEFNPNFGRIVSNPGDIKTHYSDNGSLLFTPKNYNPKTVSFFTNTGYLPGEIVTIGGVDHLVINNNGNLFGRDLSTGVESDISSKNDLRRTNNTLVPEQVTTNVGSGIRAPVLNPGMVLDNLYSKFIDGYTKSIDDYNEGLKKAGNSPTVDIQEPSFSGFMQGFFHDNGLENKDIGSFTSYFTKKIGDDLAGKVLPVDEIAIRNKLNLQYRSFADDRVLDHSVYLSNQALSNNLFYSPEGSGKYKLRFQDTGKTYAIVGSPEEALDAINKIRQSSGLDKDGGYTGIVPTGIGNKGGLTSLYSPDKAGLVENYIDTQRMGGVISRFTPVGRMLQSVDNLANQNGVQSKFYPKFLDLQDNLIKRKNLIDSDPSLKALSTNGQKLLDYLSGIKSDRRMVVADNVDTMDIDQIKNNYLGRTMTPIEETLADNMAKSGNVSEIKDLLYKTRLGNKQASLGGNSFMSDLMDMGKLYDPDVAKQAIDFVNITSKFGKDLASGDGIMRLAEALEDPRKALDQQAHARLNNITPQETKAVNMIQDFFKQAAPIAGIDPKAQFQVYLPTIVRKIAGSFNGDLNMNVDFAHEMSRLGISPRGELIRDPSQLISKYWTALVNHKSGFYDAVTDFKDEIDKEIEGFKGTKLESSTNSFSSKMDQYTRQVYGYPDPNDALSKSMNQLAASMGAKTLSQNSVLNLMSLGLIAGRPALAVRDFLNIWGLAWSSFGNEFTSKFLSNSVDPDYVKALKDKNILPNSASAGMIDPSIDESSIIPGNGKFQQIIKSWSDKGFKISGQEFSYEHANAGIFQTSMDMAEKYFEQIRSKEITKAEAFDKMGITGNYGSGMISQIDDLLTQGKTDKAAELYGKANMRYLSHVYGFHNNPIGWQSGWGRLLSQYGSWSANASQTYLDQMTRGSKSQIAGKIARIAMFNQAIVGAGNASGLNLNSWRVSNPMTVWPGTGPLVNMWSDAADKSDKGEGIPSILMKDAAGFLPYAHAAKGWLRGLDALSNGNIAQGIGGLAGAPLDNSK